MPKNLIVDPKDVRRRDELQLGTIPVNAYAKTLAEELAGNAAITPERAVRIYRDMALIREFETMLDNIKKLGEYEGVSYQHAGPAHLSIGQEAAAVGEMVHLTIDDHIFGSHRSHGEIIFDRSPHWEHRASRDVGMLFRLFEDDFRRAVDHRRPGSRRQVGVFPGRPRGRRLELCLAMEPTDAGGPRPGPQPSRADLHRQG